jgi:uncharacterized protein involved in tolerance to divalent cations
MEETTIEETALSVKVKSEKQDNIAQNVKCRHSFTVLIVS